MSDLLMQDRYGKFHYHTIFSSPFIFYKELDKFRKFYLEASAGQKIVRFVKKALDDEIYLTEIRKKIDWRKTEDLYINDLKKNKSLKRTCLI